MPPKNLLPVADALKRVLDAASPIADVETIALREAFGRTLARDLLATRTQPPFDVSAMDGYGVRHADISTPGARVKLVGEAAAGRSFPGEVKAGECVRIFTGAPVPQGADAILIQEDAIVEGAMIGAREPIRKGQHIRVAGVDFRADEVGLKAGARLGPAELALAAAMNHATVPVTRRPRVALLSTGSELVEVHERPQGAQIRNSNTYSLAGYATKAGAEVVQAGIVVDDFEVTRQAIADALTQADVVMLSGGVSMGDYDLVKPALQALGAEILVEKVAMHPGKPTVFARLGEQVIFGLPGNPVSVAVSFHLFARPVLLKMQGASEIHLPRKRAYVTRQVKGAPPRRSHQPARLQLRDGRAKAEPLKWGGSSDLVAFMQADALIVVPEDCASLNAGELAEVIQLPS